MIKKRQFLKLIAGAVFLLYSCENPPSDKQSDKDTSTTTSTASEVADGEKYKIDTTASSIKWKGKKTTGEHFGSVKIKEGYLLINKDSVVGGDVQIDMNTIVVEDIKDAETNAKLVGHLKDKDFFDVTNNPTATFTLSNIKNKDGKDMATGQLKIKGINKEISFPVKVTVEGKKITAKGTAIIDRTLWDIKYGSGKFFDNLGDKTIKDEIEIEFDLTAKP